MVTPKLIFSDYQWVYFLTKYTKLISICYFSIRATWTLNLKLIFYDSLCFLVFKIMIQQVIHGMKMSLALHLLTIFVQLSMCVSFCRKCAWWNREAKSRSNENSPASSGVPLIDQQRTKSSAYHCSLKQRPRKLT